MADFWTHQLWANKSGDASIPQTLVLQLRNTHPTMDLSGIIKMWTDRKYEVDQTQCYNYCSDQLVDKNDIKLDIDLTKSGILNTYSEIRRLPKNAWGDLAVDNLATTNRKNRKAKTMATKAIKKFTVHGVEVTLKEMATKYNVNIATLRARIARGVKGDELVQTSVHGGSARAKTYEVPHSDGKGKVVQMTVKELAKAADVPVPTMRARIQRGLQGDSLFTGKNPLAGLRGRSAKFYEVVEETKTGMRQVIKLSVADIATKFELNPATVRARIAKGFSPLEIVNGKERKVKVKTTKTNSSAVSPKSTKKKSNKPVMSPEDLIAGLEEERDAYLADQFAMKAKKQEDSGADIRRDPRWRTEDSAAA